MFSKTLQILKVDTDAAMVYAVLRLVCFISSKADECFPLYVCVFTLCNLAQASQFLLRIILVELSIG